MIIYEWLIDLGAELVDDRVIGFDISVADKDKDGSFSWLAWGPGTQKVDMPDRCGEFMFVRPETQIRRGLGDRRLERRVGSDPPVSGPDSVDRAPRRSGEGRSSIRRGPTRPRNFLWAPTRSTPSIRPKSASM